MSETTASPHEIRKASVEKLRRGPTFDRPESEAIPYPTPLQAIRAACVDCTGGCEPDGSGKDLKAIRECPLTDCALHPYRMGKRPDQPTGRTPIKAIRAKCLDLCCGEVGEVNKGFPECHDLWPYRLGRRPNTAEKEIHREVSARHAERAVLSKEGGN